MMNEGKTEERKTGIKQNLRGKRVKERTNEDLSSKKKTEKQKMKEGKKEETEASAGTTNKRRGKQSPGYISLSSNVQGSLSHVCS